MWFAWIVQIAFSRSDSEVEGGEDGEESGDSEVASRGSGPETGKQGAVGEEGVL